MDIRIMVMLAVLSAGCVGSRGTASEAGKEPAPPPLFDQVKNAAANTWIEVPNSRFMAAAPKSNQFPGTWGNTGVASVIVAWCGGAYDSKRDRLVVWGGGHHDYRGNELYAFDVRKMAWERLNDPYLKAVDDQELNKDGTPHSRHTYGGLAYLAHADRFFAQGGALSGCGYAKCDRMWTFDFDAMKWEDRQPGGDLPGSSIMACAYDAASKTLYMGSGSSLFAYDYEKNTWAKLDAHGVGNRSLVFDPKRKLLVAAGGGSLSICDVGKKDFKPQSLKIAGGEDIVNAGNPAGLDYDPVSGFMVGWAARTPGKVSVLDLDAKKWEDKQAEGGPTGGPSNGIFGRWRYVPSLNAFIAVNSANGNVFFYKHTAGDGPPPKDK